MARPSSLYPGLRGPSRADSAVLAFALALDLAVRIRVLADAELALALARLLILRDIVTEPGMRPEDELELELSFTCSPGGTAHSGHLSRW